MTEPSPASLPIINIAPFLPPSSSASTSTTPLPSRSEVLSSLRTALLEHGFFYLTGYSSADAASISAVLSEARTFFQTAPAAEKALLKRQDVGVGLGDGARGYQVTGENVTGGRRDWHEALDWYAPMRAGEGVEAADLTEGRSSGVAELRREGQPREGGTTGPRANGTAAAASAASANGTSSNHAGSNHADVNHAGASSTVSASRSPPFALCEGINLWPSTPATFRQTFTSHVALMRTLGTAVLRAMGEALALSQPDVFADAVDDSFWVLRAIGYPPLDPALAAEGGVSCGAHSDYGCLTLLAADDTTGALQVWDRGAGVWSDVPPREGAIVVNVGDMVERWTAGWVASTRHRVVHTGAGYRVSVPFFLEPGREVRVAALAECVATVAEGGGKGEGREGEGELRYWDHLRAKVGGNFYSGGGA